MNKLIETIKNFSHRNDERETRNPLYLQEIFNNGKSKKINHPLLDFIFYLCNCIFWSVCSSGWVLLDDLAI